MRLLSNASTCTTLLNGYPGTLPPRLFEV